MFFQEALKSGCFLWVFGRLGGKRRGKVRGGGVVTKRVYDGNVGKETLNECVADPNPSSIQHRLQWNAGLS